MKKKSDNNNDKVNNNNVEGERVVSTRDVRSVSSPALCSPAPRAAMLAVARGTAPNSLPDWSIWSRDRGAVVGVIGSPRLHTYAAHVTSLRCTGSRTLANHILRHKLASLHELKINIRIHVRLDRCTETRIRISKRVRDVCADARKDVEDYHTTNVEVISWRTEAGFSGSNRGQERVSNWIDRNFEDASCSDFMVPNRRGDFFFLFFFCTLILKIKGWNETYLGDIYFPSKEMNLRDIRLFVPSGLFYFKKSIDRSTVLIYVIFPKILYRPIVRWFNPF